MDPFQPTFEKVGPSQGAPEFKQWVSAFPWVVQADRKGPDERQVLAMYHKFMFNPNLVGPSRFNDRTQPPITNSLYRSDYTPLQPHSPLTGVPERPSPLNRVLAMRPPNPDFPQIQYHN